MAQFRAILRTLAEHEVRFIIVGGVAAVLQGAPIHTNDLDIVYALDELNQERLLSALGKLGAVFRDDPRQLKPNLSHLASTGHKLLSTDYGALDCLGSIETDTTYLDLERHVDTFEIGGVMVSVISLPRLIEVKEKLTRPKDQLALIQLRAALEERSRGLPE